MTDLPAYLQPFVLSVADVTDVRVDRAGELDLYRPAGGARRGAILFVHGGPGPADLAVLPRDWPVYRGYATTAAQRGLVGAVPNHSLIRGFDLLRTASDDVEAAVGVLRADPQVDPDRIALWFFSGSGLLAGEWLDSRPEWLRCVLLTYPLLATPPGVDELVSAAEVIGKHKDLPVLLTRVGRERAALAGPVAEFVSAGGTALDIIDVPKGQHGFDMLDHTEESRAAVTKALDWAIAHLGEEPADQLPLPAGTASSSTATSSSTTTTSPKTTTTSSVTSSTTSTTARKKAARAATPPTTPPTTSTATTTPPRPAEAAADTLTAVPPTVFSDAAVAPADPVLMPGAAITSPPPVPADTPATRVVGREQAAASAHDLEAFLAMYSPTAQVQFTDGTVLKGRRSLREYYRPRFESGRSKSEQVQRMTLGDWVVDQTILHDSDEGSSPAITLYRVQDGLITEVRFLG